MAQRRLVGFDDNNQRRDLRRHLGGVTFIVHGRAFAVVDLSMGGFLLAEARGFLGLGQEVTIGEVETPDDGTVRFGASAEIVRTDYRTGSMAGRFQGLSPRQFEVVEALLMHRPLTRRKPAPKKRKGLLGLFRKG